MQKEEALEYAIALLQQITVLEEQVAALEHCRDTILKAMSGDADL